MLFGALSPALAALTFDGRSDILGRLLGAPVALEFTAAICTTTSDGSGATAHAKGDDSSKPHASHDVYCLFCLASAATLTLISGPSPAPAASHVHVMPLAVGRSHTPQFAPGSRLARGPPVMLQHA